MELAALAEKSVATRICFIFFKQLKLPNKAAGIK